MESQRGPLPERVGHLQRTVSPDHFRSKTNMFFSNSFLEGCVAQKHKFQKNQPNRRYFLPDRVFQEEPSKFVWHLGLLYNFMCGHVRTWVWRQVHSCR